jgi:hypothetical protein
LPGFRAHSHEKAAKLNSMRLQQFLARVALDYDWIVEQEQATLSIVSPYAFSLGEGCASAKKGSKKLERLINPAILINLSALLGMNSTNSVDSFLIAASASA